MSPDPDCWKCGDDGVYCQRCGAREIDCSCKEELGKQPDLVCCTCDAGLK